MSKSNARLAVVNELAPRDELRAAQANHSAALDELGRISAARQHARETSTEAFKRLGAIEEKIAEAKRLGDKRLAASALGEVDGNPAPTDADLQRAQADRDIAKRTERALADREDQQHSRVESTVRAIEVAVAAVIRDETAETVTTLLAKATARQAETVAARAELRHLLHSDAIAEPVAGAVKSFLSETVGILPGTYGGVELQDFSKHFAADRWRAAMAKLRVDADAQLPAS